MNRPVWLLLLALIFFGSCVPNKKIVYLQNDDVKAKNIPTDTVLRSYPLDIKEYKIQPLDLLYIRIESLTEEDFDFIAKLYPIDQNGNLNAQFLNGFLVDNTGSIEFPVVGLINLQGLSIFEAQLTLQKAFAPYLRDPVARVRLLNFRFTVLGEVNRENQVTSNNPRVTLMEAVGLAGGLTDLADRTKVKVIRQKGTASEIYYINLLEEELISKQHYYVQQNDIIVVPALRQRPFRKYFGQNLALFISSVSVLLLTVSLLQ